MSEEEYEDDEIEGTLLAATKKYQEFRESCQDLLDPNLEEEFETMRQMGLPTMLVNSYDDMEDEEEVRARMYLSMILYLHVPYKKIYWWELYLANLSKLVILCH